MRRGVRIEDDQGVTFVELFFDLVFVYAVTQLTASLLANLSWSGVGRAAVLFWLVWWAWTQFTWTLNLADTEHVLVRLPILAATAAAFFLAQAIPDAYGSGGLWFASTYVAVRVIGLAMQGWVARAGAQPSLALARWIGFSGIGLLLVTIGAAVDEPVRVWLWVAAVGADLFAAERAGDGPWEIVPGHFAERHGLIVIIALGESLIAAGVASAGVPRGRLFASTAAGAVIGACALWWTYFGVLHGRLTAALAAEEDERGRLARDVFSLWHALVIFGVIGVAIGFEEAIAHPRVPLEPSAALALGAGVILFVGGLTGAAARARVGVFVAPRVAFILVIGTAVPAWSAVAAPLALWTVALATVALAVAEAVLERRLPPVARDAASRHA